MGEAGRENETEEGEEEGGRVEDEGGGMRIGWAFSSTRWVG